MKCVVRKKYLQDGFEAFFFEERFGKIHLLRPTGEWVERDAGLLVSWEEQSKDAWNFPNEALPLLIQTSGQEGIKTENDSKTEGLLEATKYHLEDMRKLAFEGMR